MILNDATRRQVDAATPQNSTWLSANAGSGKTRVLTDRVARLLLGGTPPENILCLTYTKAAASEMQNRLFQRLGAWAMMPEGQLRKALIELGDDTTITPEQVRRARQLFARAIETPGGLKIQTIHSFCSGLLRRFPLEAGVSPQFKEMEDRAAQILREEVLDDMASGDNTTAIDGIAQHYTGADINDFLAGLTGRRTAFQSTFDEPKFKRIFGLGANANKDDALSIALIGGEAGLVDDLVDAAKHAPASYQKFAATLKALDLNTPTLDTLQVLFSTLLYADKTSKSRNWPQSNHTKAVEALAHLTDDMHAWMDRTATAFQHFLNIQAYEKTHALYAFATPFVTAYEARKAERAALDFDDLILKAKALLQDPAVAQWVLFRLDGGVDHVLVDEAQDTSPDQWDIIRLLTQEFAAGLGAQADKIRTIFVVGDKKQSIYSFQGADPEGFDRMQDHFKTELAQVDQTLHPLELEYSFRSSEAVLSFVDTVFKREMAKGLGDDIRHIAFHDAMPGRVDLWPAIDPIDKPEDREWDDPVDMKGETNHKVILATRIASEIKRMIDPNTGETLPVRDGDTWKRRKITPGDILILVQRRSDLFQEIITACKAANLEIAGADRLKLGGELAVKDISALLRFLALPEDDLSLAEALKSPLFGWTEDQLYALAQPRPKGQSLWEALRRSKAPDATMAILNDLRRQSDFLRPFDLITRLLVRHEGRKNLLARLGHEAEDGIDALLSQSLAYESTAVPSLTGFLGWLKTEDVTVKRQMDSASDRIRVMTVHGAKGLEAPIVILPDTATRKRQVRGDLLVTDQGPIWKPKADVMPDGLRDIQDDMLNAQDEERRRLLYVALTRAENWLIIAAAGETGTGEDSWHATLSDAMTHVDAVDETAAFGTIKRFSRWDWTEGDLVSPTLAAVTTDPLPAFAPDIPEPPNRLQTRAPSDLGGAKIMPGDTHDDASEIALAWGRMIHVLLEHLPTHAAQHRETTARHLIESHPDAGLIDDQNTLIGEALSLINAPDLTWIFAPGTLAEVPISATLPNLNNERLFGIIDRLIVHDDEIIAIDYKSNRIVPDSPEKTPNGLVRQMAAYRDALAQIYPSHRIRTLLLWTRTGTLTELENSQLDRALNAVSTP